MPHMEINPLSLGIEDIFVCLLVIAFIVMVIGIVITEDTQEDTK